MEIASNNFNVDSEGNMTCNNAIITGGRINLPIDNNYPGITIGDPNIQSNGNTLWISQSHIVNTNTNGCQIDLDTTNKQMYISDHSRGAGYVTFIHPGLITVFTESNTISTDIKGEGITTPTLVQTSLESQKKNFEKLDNAIEIIKRVDIYKYNLKSEKDTDKKHIGFIIGDNYQYAKELTSKENNGADIYSLASCCLQAIKEQQKTIEDLKNEIKELKESGK